MTTTDASLNATGVGNIAGIDGLSGSGFTGTLLAGCDVRLHNFVVGAFGDYTWMDDNSARVTGALGKGLAGLAGTSELIGFDNQWTVGGRLGYVVAPGIMPYGLIGYTQADASGLAAKYISDTFDGVSFGGGVEFNIGGGWYGQLEYRYTDFDDESLNLGGASIKVDPDEQAVRAALLYHFDLW